MISVTWMMDADRNIEYLECRDEEAGSNKADVVKVYFYDKYDVRMIKGKKLEMRIAWAIFSNRAKYGDIIDAYLEVFNDIIYFRIGTNAEIYNEHWPIKNRE